ncbi:hypothetical protein F4814DRAFT_447002 [Daldinia grandis]|nr:hypothetical protein F4814DRAFT_447002 [Daldinia grandis]
MEEPEAGPSETQQPPRSPSASPSASPEMEMERCVICMFDVDEQEFTTLPCSHGFHAECLYSHSVVDIGRPLGPNMVDNWELISPHQLEVFAGPGAVARRFLSWNEAHPGAELFSAHDDDDPYAPPNIIPTDGELQLDIPKALEGRRHLYVERPKHYNFHFVIRPEDYFKDGNIDNLTKSIVIVAMQNDWTGMVEAQIRRLRTEFQTFRLRWPDEILPVSDGAFETLLEAYAKLKVKYFVFKRQHEGFIELGPVALRYRDAAENELRVRMDDFWEKFEWVRKEMGEASKRVST